MRGEGLLEPLGGPCGGIDDLPADVFLLGGQDDLLGYATRSAAGAGWPDAAAMAFTRC